MWLVWKIFWLSVKWNWNQLKWKKVDLKKYKNKHDLDWDNWVISDLCQFPANEFSFAVDYRYNPFCVCKVNQDSPHPSKSTRDGIAIVPKICFSFGDHIPISSSCKGQGNGDHVDIGKGKYRVVQKFDATLLETLSLFVSSSSYIFVC